MKKMLNPNELKYLTTMQNNLERIVRNDFEKHGKYEMPKIKKTTINIDDAELLSYGNSSCIKNNTCNKIIHFFIDDYKFEGIYKTPQKYLNKFNKFGGICTPDYSLYVDMPKALQIYNTFRNRWCGAYYQQHGINVIPTISWSDEKSFEFCFDGIEKESIVAISTHGNYKYKKEFLKGYNKMLEIIEPSVIICYGKPFPEMKGNFKVFDYKYNEYTEVANAN